MIIASLFSEYLQSVITQNANIIDVISEIVLLVDRSAEKHMKNVYIRAQKNVILRFLSK